MIFLFAVSARNAAAYQSVISGLANLGQDHLRLERLVDASDSQTMFEVLREISLPKRRAADVNTRMRTTTTLATCSSQARMLEASS
jgi:hypothetical protein